MVTLVMRQKEKKTSKKVTLTIELLFAMKNVVNRMIFLAEAKIERISKILLESQSLLDIISISLHDSWPLIW